MKHTFFITFLILLSFSMSAQIKKEYHENDTLKSIGNYANGLQDGEWKYYFESGVLKAEAIFIEGFMNGKYKSYYESGEVYSQGMYRRGRELKIWFYDKKGTEIKK